MLKTIAPTKGRQLFILFAFFAFAKFTYASKGEEARPNIIFILTDDQLWDAIGYAGNKIIHTPEMDQLAKAGCYFHKAMVSTPICAASRATILSGLYERTHKYTFQTGPMLNRSLTSQLAPRKAPMVSPSLSLAPSS